MTYVCEVCKQEIKRGETGRDDGDIQVEGVTQGRSKAWIWGPVTVHMPCRLKLETPYDDQDGYVRTWDTLGFD